jgi:hypothetical protein
MLVTNRKRKAEQCSHFEGRLRIIEVVGRAERGDRHSAGEVPLRLSWISNRKGINTMSQLGMTGYMLLAVGAGVSFVLQQAVNADLRAALASAAWAGFASYLGGTICMLILAFALRHAPFKRSCGTQQLVGVDRRLLRRDLYRHLYLAGAAPRNSYVRGASGHGPDAVVASGRSIWALRRGATSGAPDTHCRSGATGVRCRPHPAVRPIIVAIRTLGEPPTEARR